MGRNSGCRVVIQIAQYVEPSRAFRRCQTDSTSGHLSNYSERCDTFPISHAGLTDNGQIKCPQKMGFPRSILPADQNAATAIQATEIQRMFAVERAKVFERERVDIDF